MSSLVSTCPLPHLSPHKTSGQRPILSSMLLCPGRRSSASTCSPSLLRCGSRNNTWAPWNTGVIFFSQNKQTNTHTTQRNKQTQFWPDAQLCTGGLGYALLAVEVTPGVLHVLLNLARCHFRVVLQKRNTGSGRAEGSLPCMQWRHIDSVWFSSEDWGMVVVSVSVSTHW